MIFAYIKNVFVVIYHRIQGEILLFILICLELGLVVQTYLGD